MAARLLIPTLLVALASACGRASVAREVGGGDDALPLTVRIADSITLHESPEVINVEPAVSIDPRGGYIVADMVEAQVRLYGPGGNLKGHFGRRGGGPREFSKGVTSALRLPSGEIAVFEMGGKIFIYDADGTTRLRTQDTSLFPIYDAAVLDSQHVVISGRRSGPSETPLVHIWNLRTQKVDTSFFEVPAHPREFDQAYSYSGFADIAVRDGVIAAVFALRDTVFLFDRDGTARGQVPIPAPRFRPLRKPMPENATPVEQQAWLQSFSTFSSVFWTSDGLLLAQYFDVEGVEPRWSLVGFDTSGTPKMRYERAELLAVSPQDSLIFDHPSAIEPNQWAVASLLSR